MRETGFSSIQVKQSFEKTFDFKLETTWKFRRKVTPFFSYERDPLFRLKVTPWS